MDNSKITIQVTINTDQKKAWEYYTNPQHITHWNFASDDWQCPQASNDLKVGGKYIARMEAKDGSFGFDFAGTYTKIVPQKLIEYAFGDRNATVEFLDDGNAVTVRVTFDAESENPGDMQRGGWQAILDNFKKHVETGRRG